MIKIKKHYFNERGAVLLVAVMMTSILMLLGITASMVSISSYKMRKTESVVKKNFHISEAISQEAEMKLDEYIKEYLYESRKEVEEYIEKNEDSDMDIEQRMNKEEKTEMFKNIFKEKLKTLKKDIEDTNSYNLKIIEKHEISVEVVSEYLEKQEDVEEFDMSIISLFEDQNILEKVKIKYKISMSELKHHSFKADKNVIEKIQWSNYRW